LVILLRESEHSLQYRDQKDEFLESEGDAWFERNHRAFVPQHDPIIAGLFELGQSPGRVLEIGCSDGARLSALHETFSSECSGIDPSADAVRSAQLRAKNLDISVGTADKLAFADSQFDLVIFGFCLYLCDVSDHFKIASEADRVLADGGVLVVYDFSSPIPFKNEYIHKPGIWSYKMDWAKMFTWHPSYRLIARRYSETASSKTFVPNEAIVADFLRKDVASAFPSNPW
jgi:ubiquinone/menaquinone biosynthesis C-methylase UbiE